MADISNVFFDIDIAGEKAGRIVFKLYDDIVPKVCPPRHASFSLFKAYIRRPQTFEDLLPERSPTPMMTCPRDSDTKELISTESSRGS